MNDEGVGKLPSFEPSPQVRRGFDTAVGGLALQ